MFYELERWDSMKKMLILFIIIGLFLVGCSQKEQPETSVTVAKSNSETKMELLDLKETSEIAIFNTAVSDSTKEPGIRLMQIRIINSVLVKIRISFGLQKMKEQL